MLQLTYYAAKGSCDKIRVLLAEAGASYQENIITSYDYDEIAEGLEFGGLPVFEDGKVRIVYPNTIMRYIATKFGYAGNTIEEQARCDMWMEACEETLQELWNADFMKKDTYYNSNPLRLKFVDSYLAPRLAKICQMLSIRTTSFLIGDKISYADICLFCMLDCIDREFAVVLGSFPLLKEYHTEMINRPRIKRFCEGPHRY